MGALNVGQLNRVLLLASCCSLQTAIAHAQDVVVQSGHNASIVAVAANSTRGLLASADRSLDRFKLWDMQSRRELRTVETDFDLASLSFGPDGKVLAAAMVNCRIALFDPESGSKIKDLQAPTAGREILVDPQSGRQITLDAYKPERERGIVTNDSMPVAFSSKGVLAGATPVVNALGGTVWYITLWGETGNALGRLVRLNPADRDSTAITALAFSTDGQWLVSGREDGTIEIWDIASQRRLKYFPRTVDFQVSKIAIDPQKSVVVASGDGSYSLARTSVDSGETQRIPVKATAVAFTPDGKTLLAGAEQSVEFWDISRGSRTGSALIGDEGSRVGTLSLVDEHLFVATASNKFFLVDSLNQSALPLFNTRADVPAAVVAERSGSSVFVAEGNTIRRWDLRTARLLPLLLRAGGEITGVQSAPAGDWILVSSQIPGAHPPAGQLEVFRLSDGGSLWKIDVKGVESPCISPSGANIAYLENREKVHIVGARDGRELESFAVANRSSAPVMTSPSPGPQLPTAVYQIRFFTDAIIAATGQLPLDFAKLRKSFEAKIVTLGADQQYQLSLWDVRSHKRVLAGPIAESGPVAVLESSPSSGSLAYSFPEGTAIHVWHGGSQLELPPLGANGEALAFNEDGALLASGDLSGNIALWETETGRQLASVKATSGGIRQLAFAPGGKTLIASVDDGGVQLRDTPSLTLRATFFFSQDRFAVFTSGDFYYAPRGVFDFVSFRSGGRAYAVDQFDLKFNRPDKVLSVLGSPDAETIAAFKLAYERRIRLLKTQGAEAASASAPELRLKGKLPLTTNAAQVDIPVEAFDKQADLDRLQVYDNGAPVYGSGGIDISNLHTRQYSAVLHVELTAGTNHLQLSAMNTAHIESLRQNVDITSSVHPNARNLLIIAVGVSKYRDQAFSLPFPAKDSSDFAHFFADSWSARLIQAPLALPDDHASREQIRDLKKVLLSSTRVDDLVIMLLAGHGDVDRNFEYHFAPYDTNFRQSSDSSADGLSFAEIEGLMDGIPARRKLILLDTCHTGELEPTAISRSPSEQSGNVGKPEEHSVRVFRPAPVQASQVALEEEFLNLRRSTGTIAIGASEGFQEASETTALQNGTFTYAVLEGLGRNPQHRLLADSNDDGVVMMSELREYIIRRVAELTHGRQTPVTRAGSDEFDFAVVGERHP